MKIFIGIHEIANLVKEFEDALSAAGYHVETLSYPSRQFYENNRYTYTLKFPRLFRKTKYTRFLYPILVLPFYLPLIFKFDVFVFVWATTFLPLNLDLLLLKLLGKKVVIFNCGSDVRYRPIQYKIDTEVLGIRKFHDKAFEDVYVQNTLGFTRTFYSQKFEEWSGCQIVSIRDQATFQKEDCYLFHFPTKKILDQAKKTNSTPLIIHAPSNRAIKGTEYVLEAIGRLRKQGLDFEFELIEGKDNAYVLSRLAAADIAVDEPGVWIAKFAAEALAAGCIVIGGNNPGYIGFDDVDSPVIQFNPDPNDLALKLQELISNKARRQELMNRSYEHWKNNYSPEAFVTYFEDLLAGRAKKFSALPNHKDILLRFSQNYYQRTLIRLLY